MYLLLLRRLFVVVIVAVLYAPSTRGQTALASQLAASPTATPLPDFIYDSVGRFVYVSLTKKF